MNALATGLFLLLAACNPRSPAPTAISVSLSETPQPSRATLPLTWTPTFTATALPPTVTRTPTSTPTVAPTLSAEDVCRDFWVVSNLNTKPDSPPRFFNGGSIITVLVYTTSADDTPRFVAKNHATGEARGMDIVGGQTTAGQIAASQLPGTGQYDWTLSVQSAAYGEICQQAGTFFITGRESTREEENTIR